jgi:SAM-dependent methyltransferase
MPTSLDELINQLPERYQPIYGRDLSDTARQSDDPRTGQILDIIDALHGHLGRPLRVLDLGSAQGFFTLKIAERGHHATGVDYLQINIDVANAIAEEHRNLDVHFVQSDLLQIDELIRTGEFDLVLGLSVLHHILHRDGEETTRRFLHLVANHIPHGLFEMALNNEPLYWADFLPDDPRFTLGSYSFIREVGRSGTHLSAVERPLLYCSSTLALINGSLHRIKRFRTTSHDMADLVHTPDRRYFELESDMLVKVAATFEPGSDPVLLAAVQAELRAEHQRLQQLRDYDVAVPQVIEIADLASEVLLARTMVPGTLVSDLQAVSDGDLDDIFTGVLDALVNLERLGLYHTDLRTWNVLWSAAERRATLIDYGAMSAVPSDVVWPFDHIHSFVLFTLALFCRSADSDGQEPSTMSPIISHPRSPTSSTSSSAANDHPRSPSFATAGQPGPNSWPTMQPAQQPA